VQSYICEVQNTKSLGPKFRVLFSWAIFAGGGIHFICNHKYTKCLNASGEFQKSLVGKANFLRPHSRMQ
jgi:hypothetical protein